jgi:hypothetical protein
MKQNSKQSIRDFVMIIQQKARLGDIEDKNCPKCYSKLRLTSH